MAEWTVVIPEDHLQGALDAARADGWEVQSTRPTVTRGGVAAYELTLKRPMSVSGGSPQLMAFLKLHTG